MESTPYTRAKRSRWDELWIRIRFTRTQMILALLGLVLAGGAAFAVWKGPALAGYRQRAAALEKIEEAKRLLGQLETSAQADAATIAQGRDSIGLAEDALQQDQPAEGLRLAEEAVASLEASLTWAIWAAGGVTARFERIEGSVQVLRPGRTDWEQATPQTVVDRSCEVRTGQDGSARMRFEHGATTDLQPDSLIRLRDIGVDPVRRSVRTDLQLDQGSVRLVSRGERDTTQLGVRTGSFEASGRITVTARQDSRSGGGAQFVVEEGSGQFSSQGRLVTIPERTRINVDASGRASAPRPILSAPRPIGADLQWKQDAGGASQPIATFRWSAVDGAAGYVLELAPSSRFEPLFDRRKVKKTHVELDGLPPGVHWWRLRSVDKEGVESEPGEVRSLRIRQDHGASGPRPEGPKVEFDKLRLLGRETLLVEGSLPRGAQLYVNGERVEVQLNGGFRSIVTIEAGQRKIRVEAIDADGNSSISEQQISP